MPCEDCRGVKAELWAQSHKIQALLDSQKAQESQISQIKDLMETLVHTFTAAPPGPQEDAAPPMEMSENSTQIQHDSPQASFNHFTASAAPLFLSPSPPPLQEQHAVFQEMPKQDKRKNPFPQKLARKKQGKQKIVNDSPGTQARFASVFEQVMKIVNPNAESPMPKTESKPVKVIGKPPKPVKKQRNRAKKSIPKPAAVSSSEVVDHLYAKGAGSKKADAVSAIEVEAIDAKSAGSKKFEARIVKLVQPKRGRPKKTNQSPIKNPPKPSVISAHSISCNICGKNIKTDSLKNRASNLRQHAVKHLSLMRFACAVCGKECKRLSSARFHLKLHHPKELQKANKNTDALIQSLVEKSEYDAAWLNMTNRCFVNALD